MHFECYHCDANFKIEHNLDGHYYEVYFCPFCGGEITEEGEKEINDELDI